MGHFLPDPLSKRRSVTSGQRHVRILGRHHAGKICPHSLRPQDRRKAGRRAFDCRGGGVSTSGLACPKHHWECRSRVYCGLISRTDLPMRHSRVCQTSTQEYSNQLLVRGGFDGLIWRCTRTFHHRIIGTDFEYSRPSPNCVDIVCVDDRHVAATPSDWQENGLRSTLSPLTPTNMSLASQTMSALFPTPRHFAHFCLSKHVAPLPFNRGFSFDSFRIFVSIDRKTAYAHAGRILKRKRGWL